MPYSFTLPHTDSRMTSTTSANTSSSGLSSALARASSSSVRQWTCPCLNVRLSLSPESPTPSEGSSGIPWLAELASDDAIHVEYPSLVSRETVSLAENNSIACAKCLNCDTIVYAASKPAPPGPARALGFNTLASSSGDAVRESRSPVSPSAAKQLRSPSRDSADRLNSRTNESPVRPLDRKVWILPEALSPEQASNAAASEAFSPAFKVVIPRTNANSTLADRPATAAHAPDSARDPIHPASDFHKRTSSYGSGANSIAYALPAVPQHLITSPPNSPRVGAPTPHTATSTGAVASPTPSHLGSSLSSALVANPLASQLDSVAIERLKDLRSKAEAEVFELVRQKRREMEQLEKRFREEAESLLAVTKTSKQTKSKTSSSLTVSLIEKALLEQKQHQSHPLDDPQRVNARDSARHSVALTTSAPSPSSARTSTGAAQPRDVSTTQSSVSSSGRRNSLYDEYSDLPPSAFERRPTYTTAISGTATSANTGVQSTVPSSLGGLSASFAMRGRELPTQMQDWAEKRRLRERYPQGDHSALPSAATSTANSNANSAANSIVDSEEDAWAVRNGADPTQERHRTRENSANTQDDAEMDRRGRGRLPSHQRGSSSSREPREPRRLHDEQHQPSNGTPKIGRVQQLAADRQDSGRDRTGRPPASTFNPPPAMSSSLLAKRPALAYVDDGRDADENTPSVGGKLISPQSIAEPSAQVTLRPRDPPPSTAEPLKPATRSAASVASAEDGNRSRASNTVSSTDPTTTTSTPGPHSPTSRKTFEKKVAFAETEDRVDHAIISDEYDDDGEDEDASASVQQTNSGPSASRSHEVKPALVDESADAVFEIDEETEDVDADADADDDGEVQESQLSPEDSDRHKVEIFLSDLRTGASGRPQGQADDALPGYEDEAEGGSSSRRGPSSGSLSDDFRSSLSSDDEDAVPPGFGAASFSALAASQSAMHTLASSLARARARADGSGFDPASLRMDGRIVVPPSSVSNRDLEAESEPFVVGSLRSSSRRMSVQLPSNTTQSSRKGGEAIAGTQGQAPGSVSGGARHQRSSSRNRISNMSKEDADTEVRLSGLLAPNAPSHRSLWSPKEAKARRSGKHKYKLNDEDNLKWDLWKRKVGSGDAATPAASGEAAFRDAESKHGSRSTPMAVAPPSQFIAAGSGIGPRPLREATMIDPDSSNSINTFSVFDRHLQARTAAAGDPANATVAGGLAIGKKTWGYGSFKDNTSGFETEPKTSLPYKEKMMVPSLRKALRRSIFEPEPHAKLETIPDADDPATSPSAGRSTTASGTCAQPISGDSDQRTSAATAVKHAEHKGALPGSVITRGFPVPGGASAPGTETGQSNTMRSTSSAATELGVASVSASSKSSSAPGEQVTRDAALGASVGSSGTGTPTSVGRRSPRPVYVPPPPPTSATTVLESDPAQHPRALELFETDCDTSFRLYEEGEEEETEEGWAKVLKFMHVVEQLKTNKRTGWLHHRVAAPESIADHMYRMAMLCLLCPAEADVDLGKCVQLAIVHDLAEAEVGDLTPLDGVDKKEKVRREKEAIQYFVHDLLGSSAAGLRIEALWEEYEARQSKESRLVKDLDRFELGLQAIEYERRFHIDDLQPFWAGSLPYLTHPRIRRWAHELARERQALWQSRGSSYIQHAQQRM